MRIEIYRLTSNPISIDMDGGENGVSIREVFSQPGSGRVIGRGEDTLLEAAESEYGSVTKLGSLRVNGVSATLDSVVYGGGTIMIIPKVEAGRK